MNTMLSSRMGRPPVGVTSAYGSSPTPAQVGSPLALQGGLSVSGNAGMSGARGTSAVILLGLAGLAVFYVATRGMQGLK